MVEEEGRRLIGLIKGSESWRVIPIVPVWGFRRRPSGCCTLAVIAFDVPHRVSVVAREPCPSPCPSLCPVPYPGHVFELLLPRPVQRPSLYPSPCPILP